MPSPEIPVQPTALDRSGGSGSDLVETEEDLMRSEIGNMAFHGWWPWPARIPKQAGYEYSAWVDYGLRPQLYSRPACSFWLRIKWIFRRRSPNTEVTDAGPVTHKSKSADAPGVRVD